MTKTILILAANPKNTPSLRLDQEVREIDNGLERSRKRDEFILKQKWAARPADVRRAMLDYKPNIIHFCGHGLGEEGIAFEDENGQAKLVSADTLAGFFKLFADRVECVILNACYSEVQAEAITKYIPYVIGMKKAIGDAAAVEFSVAFYDALAAGGSIEFAYELACNSVQWTGIHENFAPVLRCADLHSIRLGTTEVPTLEDDATVRHLIQPNFRTITLDNIDQMECLLSLDIPKAINFAWSPNGETMAIVCANDIYLYEVAKLIREHNAMTSLQKRLISHTNSARTIVFSPDGRMLAIAGDNTVHINRIVDGELVLFYVGNDVAFSPNGELIVADKSIWRADGDFIRKIDYGRHPVFSPDSTLLASVGVQSGRHGATIRRVKDGSHVHTFFVPKPTNVTFSPEGTLIAVGSGDYPTRIWQVSDGRLLSTIYPGGVVAFSPDGKLLVSRNCFARLPEGEIIRTLEFQTGIRFIKNVAFSPEGNLFGVIIDDYQSDSGNIQLWGFK